MENFNWKNKLIIVTTLTVLLTGCGARERTEDRTLPDTGTSGVEETHIAEEKTDEKTDERLQPSHTEVTLLDTKPIIDENAVLYGNLHITLPDGVTKAQLSLIFPEQRQTRMRISMNMAKADRFRHVYGFEITKWCMKVDGSF